VRRWKRAEARGQFSAKKYWERLAAGGGRSRINRKHGGYVGERRVGFFPCAGDSMPPSAHAQRPELAGRSVPGLGTMSLCIAPEHIPHIPLTRM